MKDNSKMNLNMKDLEMVAGGRTRGGSPSGEAAAARHAYVRATYCHGNGLGPKHVFEFTRSEDGEIYGICECVNCGYVKIVEENPSPLAP